MNIIISTTKPNRWSSGQTRCGMADIFLSYKRTDRDRVAPIVALLEAHGWSVWWDPRIDAGEQWDEVIEREVGAASCVVAIWSFESVSSRWVRTEAGEGLDRGILVPVLIDATRPPLEFRRIHAIDLTGWRGGTGEGCANTLVCAVARFLGQSMADAGRVPGAPQVHRPQSSLLYRMRRHLIRGLRDWRQVAAYRARRRAVAAKARIKQVTLAVRRLKGTPVLPALAGALIVIVPFALWLWLTYWRDGPQPAAESMPSPPALTEVQTRIADRLMRQTAGERRLADRLLRQGERLLKQGQVQAARMAFQFAADMYLAEGAFRAAETYDPSEFHRMEVIGPRPDPVQARYWYERARDLGHPEAEKRLRRLERYAPP